MKNITVSVEEDVYQRAREVAAHRGTSVSRLVSQYLSTLDEADRHIEAARKRMRVLFEKPTGYAVGKRRSRDSLHER